jgi:uncharacterized protein involved in exopolysaccharide biosynthesis
MLQAGSAGDPSLVQLSVRSHSAWDAAAIANLWADTLVEQVNTIYGESESDVAFFEAQTAQAELALTAAEKDLVDFEARSQIAILDTQLDSLQKAQADYLQEQRRIVYTTQSIEALQKQVAGQEAGDAPSLADELTALLLQVKAFLTEPAEPIQVQMQIDSASSLSDTTREERIALLSQLASALASKSASIDVQLLALEPEILSLQERLQDLVSEKDRLIRERDLASSTYLVLARKLEEAKIVAQEERGVLRVGSYATPSEVPTGPHILLVAGLAGLLGLVIGVTAALTADSWRQGGRPTGDIED